jgi:tRNA threonylcarbamoyladenosine biosynthesis protein TsaE
VSADPLAIEFEAVGASATRALGARFAAAIDDAAAEHPQCLLFTLEGDLGTGKTTLVGGMLHAWGHAGPARSPTYTLVESYRLGAREVHHCDLYRMRHPDELEDLGLRELRRPGTLLLVEWPDKAEGRLGPADLAIRLAYRGADARSIAITPLSEAGRDVAGRL